jgi:hypothetical protein
MTLLPSPITRRMRLLSPLLAAASAALAVAVAVVWATSYFRIFGWRPSVTVSPAASLTWLATSGDGQLDLRRTDRRPLLTGQGHWAFVSPTGTRAVRLPGLVVERTTYMRWHLRPGEQVVRFPSTQPTRMTFDSVVWHVRVDYPLPFAVMAAAPAGWLTARARRRALAARRASGHCLTCGYDLRASPDRCPECGAPRSPAAPPRVLPSGEA